MNAETVRQSFQDGHIDALDISGLFAGQRLTPLAFTQACLKAASATQNIFITLTAERALAEATASTLRWQQGAPLSALDGIPLAWKDLFDVAGTLTTAGSATRRNAAVATEDAPLVAQLTRAGMVNIGKTNLSEFAFSGLGLNPAFGTPAIYDHSKNAHVPGGSSSGSALAVAAGLACFAFGTDTAGSVRIPASFNGLVGYRASRQRYDARGVFPLADTLDTLGPLCRSVRDAIALDDLLCTSASTSIPTPHFRVDDVLLNTAQPVVRENGYRLLDTLSAQGFRIELKPLEAFHQALEWIATHGWPGAREAWLLHAPLLTSDAAGQMDPLIRERLMASGQQDPSVLATFISKRQEWQQALAAELGDALLVTPTTAHTAPLLAPLQADAALFAKTNVATLRLTMPGSLLDMPGIALPSGTDQNGLSTSLLFSLPAGDDRRLLMATQAVAAAITTKPSASSEHFQ